MAIAHNLFCPGNSGSAVVAVIFLCICVFMQMLGVPVTLLSPELSPDTLGASVLEGFSVPPTVPQLTPSSETVPVTDDSPSVHVPILASVMFHPPVH